jgi:hypothetical protein
MDKDIPQPASVTVARQLDQEKLSFLSQRSEKLVLSNAQLRSDAIRNERVLTDTIAYYQLELVKKDEVISKLNEQLDCLQTESLKANNLVNLQIEGDFTNAKSALEITVRELTDKLNRAELELVSCEIYKKDKDIHNERISTLEANLKSQADEYQLELEELEKKYLVEKIRLVRSHEENIDKLKNLAIEEAHDSLRGQQRTILAENERLQSDLKSHISASKEIEKERAAAIEECVELKRSLDIVKEKEHMHVHTNQAKTVEIKKLRGRIEELESVVRENAHGFNKATNELKVTLARDLEDTTLDAAGLRTLLQYKNKEIKDIKALAATILAQRSEVETFFLESLSEVSCA